MLQFELVGLPPSYNQHFQIIWNMRECCLTPEAHLFKNRVMSSIPPHTFATATNLSISIEYHGDFYYKNGRNKKIDLQNLDKLLIDAIFKKLGMDDSVIWKMEACKVQDEKERTIVRLDEIKGE